MSYVERLIASPLVACTWEQASPTADEQHIVPDGCLDLIWTGGALIVAGPDTRPRVVMLKPASRPRVVMLKPASRLVGARLRPTLG